MKYLADFDPPSTNAEDRKVFDREYGGIRKNGFAYTYESGVRVNYTYVIRSIEYGMLNGSDVLVAFRVVRKEIDGSVVILWKILKRFPNRELQNG